MTTGISEPDYRERVAAVLAGLLGDEASPPTARAVIAALGGDGLLAQRWARPDAIFGVILAEALVGSHRFDLAVAVSLHVESVTAMLRKFAPVELRSYADGAVDGSLVGCVGASEPSGGSDLSAATTTARPVDGGWHVTGEKKFVTLSPQADFVLALARMGDAPAPRFGMVLVPRDGYEVMQTHRVDGAEALDTSWIRLDAVVPAHHLLGRPGLGLAVLTAGLVKERLSIAAQVLAACRLAIDLTVTRAHDRRQFGARLWDHQVIRLRLAALHAEHAALAAHLRLLAADPAASGRDIAGLKVTAAQFGERCVSECLHIFGGDGYMRGVSPLGELGRAVRLGRIGGGTDEMMWEIVAKGLGSGRSPTSGGPGGVGDLHSTP